MQLHYIKTIYVIVHCAALMMIKTCTYYMYMYVYEIPLNVNFDLHKLDTGKRGDSNLLSSKN